MLEVRGLTVRYDDVVAVDTLDLHADDREVVAVLGPSGCGKSTLLRAIAGLELPAEGTIRLDGRDLAGARPDQRAIGLTFQDHALFPHRSVAQNVAFGPRVQGWSAADTRQRVQEVLRLVDLAHLADRSPSELSGGEQQRVALARAIAPRPRLLMLDEPLGSLDRALRDRLLEELPTVFGELDATVLYVTHDHDEALTLADRVAVMRSGRVRQVGPPDELWRRPADAEVARFLGLDQLLPGRVVSGHEVTTVLGTLRVPSGHTPAGPGGEVTVLLLPDALAVTTDEVPPGTPAAPGTVTARRFAGDHLVVTVATDAGPTLTVPVPGTEAPLVGAAVAVTIDPRGVRLLPPR